LSAIILEKVTKHYGENLVLNGVNLKISKGEFYALMGPNGSGKTTLISIIASVKSPSSGKIEIYGKKPEKAKELIGYVPQENFSSPLLTGKENLMYFAGLLGYSNSMAKKIVDDASSEIQRKKDAAFEELKSQVAEIAVSAAEKIIRESLDAQKSKQVVDKYLNEVTKN